MGRIRKVSLHVDDMLRNFQLADLERVDLITQVSLYAEINQGTESHAIIIWTQSKVTLDTLIIKDYKPHYELMR